MTPWKAYFEVASDEALAQAARGLELEVPGSRPELVEALQLATRATLEHLLESLSIDELRALAKACGLLTGGSRETLIERVQRRASFDTGLPRRRRARPRSGARSLGRWRYQGEPFVAIDFETADRGKDSACAVALVRVEGGELVRTESRLIRPPRRRFEFTHIHGITWEQVADQPRFAELWPELEELLEGATFLAAHNAAFDRGVLEACCERAGLEAPAQPFRCTVQLARATWRQPRNRLNDVAARLGIPLDHHDATSDAQACARIVLASADA